MVMGKTTNGASGEDSSHGDSVDRINPAYSQRHSGRVDKDPAPEKSEAPKKGPPDPLDIAKKMYQDSTDYLESSLRWRWERSERSFQNRHQAGSKYFSSAFKAKSKLYRPKTRAMLRNAEANAAASFFSNMDPAEVRAVNQGDKNQRASADIHKEILKYRLTTPNQRVGVPWFLTLVGAIQDAHKYGIVTSKQYWRYETVTYEDVVTYDDGSEETVERQEVQIDRPCVDIIAPENIRIDRGADWRDPICSSPFVVILHPMYIHEIKDRMRADDPKTGAKKWHNVDLQSLKKSVNRESWDSTRQQREGNREDSKESQIEVEEFRIAWVHENIAQWDGIDWVWYTSGVYDLLSDPVPLVENYPHLQPGERPIVMGYGLIETNRTYPSSKIDLTAGLQAEANEIVNQRLDNVKLAMNKRYHVKRGAQVDLRALIRNTAGSAVLMNDVDSDVKVVETGDVTSSSYQEQDRINIDFDDIGGQFSTGTVQSNRRLNETVGGMQMLQGGANHVSELDLRVFSETWAQPVLQQIVRMQQYYENDKTILALAGANAQLFQKYGVNSITDELLSADITVRVNVGIGATDPQQKLQRFMMGADIIGNVLGEGVKQFLNQEEVVKEVMGNLGYQDGARFFDFKGQDPQVAMLMQQIQQLKQMLESSQLDNQSKEKIAEIGAQSRILAQQIDSQARRQIAGEKGQQDYNTQGLRGDQQTEQQGRDLQVKLMEMFGSTVMEEQKQEIDIQKESMRLESAEKQAKQRASQQNSGNGKA